MFGFRSILLFTHFSFVRYSPFLFQNIFIKENQLDERQLHPKLRIIVGMISCVKMKCKLLELCINELCRN